MTYRISGRKQHHYAKPQHITNFSLEEMHDQVAHEYAHWFMTRPLAPHDYVKEQYILRPKRLVATLPELLPEETTELMQILQQWYHKDFTCFRNCPKDVTVPTKLHFHCMHFQYVTDIKEAVIEERPEKR